MGPAKGLNLTGPGADFSTKPSGHGMRYTETHGDGELCLMSVQYQSTDRLHHNETLTKETARGCALTRSFFVTFGIAPAEGVCREIV